MKYFTAIPNEILDNMSDLSPAEFKVTLAIYRLIVGYSEYRKDGRRAISIGELEKATNLSRQGVVNTFEKIQEMGFLSKETNGRITIWVVNSVDKVVNSVDQTEEEIVNSVDYGSQLSVPEVVNLVDHISGDLPFKEKKKEEKKKKNPQAPLPENKHIPESNNLRFCPDWLATGDFLTAWGEWQQYHEELGRPLPAITAKKQLEKMGKWGPDRAILAINHSMENKYTGLVEPTSPKLSRNGNHVNEEFTADAIKNRLKRRKEETNAVAR